MNKEFNVNDVRQHEDELFNENASLPSRKRKHPKPTSFLEKPTFSLIIFILFILVLGGILFYYKYYNNSDELTGKGNPTEEKAAITNKTPELPTDNPSETSEDSKKQDTIPVIVISEPTKIEEEIKAENSNVASNERVKEVTHVVQAKDTLYNIAKRYYSSADVTVINRIKEVNGLTDNNIRIGMKLVIPEPTKNP